MRFSVDIWNFVDGLGNLFSCAVISCPIGQSIISNFWLHAVWVAQGWWWGMSG